MQFLNILLLFAGAFAVMGIFNVLVHRIGAPALARVFFALVSYCGAGLMLVILLATNYSLAVTGLSRVVGREKLATDIFGLLTFGTATGKYGIYLNSILALLVVLFSIKMVGLFLKRLSATLASVRARRWQQDGLGFAGQLLGLLAVGILTVAIVWFDTYMMVYRTATILFFEEMAGSAGSMPSLATLFQKYHATAGVTWLKLLGAVYPCFIVGVELALGSAAAELAQASAQWAQERAALAGQMLPTVTSPQATPVAQPVPAMPVPPPAQPVPVFTLPPQGQGVPPPAGPGMPLGTPPWERPIPVNPAA